MAREIYIRKLKALNVFKQRTSASVSQMETYRKDSGYVVRVDLPGVDPKDVHVEAEGNVLSITGERKGEEKGPEYRETLYGRFERRFTLPQGVDAGKISAHYEHGVLEL